MDLTQFVDEQMKKNPKEFKKIQKKLKQLQSQPGGEAKLDEMLQQFGINDMNDTVEYEVVDPREALRRKIKNMENQRRGRK